MRGPGITMVELFAWMTEILCVSPESSPGSQLHQVLQLIGN